MKTKLTAYLTVDTTHVPASTDLAQAIAETLKEGIWINDAVGIERFLETEADCEIDEDQRD